MDILSTTVSSVRLVTLALGAVFGGYTLSPIPPVLDGLFKTSQMFKLLVLSVIMINTIGQFDLVGVTTAVVIAAVVLVLFEYLRTVKPITH